MVNIICYVYDFGISNAPFIQSKNIFCPPFVFLARAHTTQPLEHAGCYNSHSLTSISFSINIIFISSVLFGRGREAGRTWWRRVNEWIRDYILAGSWWKSQFHLSIRKPKQQNKDCTIHIQFTFLMSVCYVKLMWDVYYIRYLYSIWKEFFFLLLLFRYLTCTSLAWTIWRNTRAHSALFLRLS